MSRNNYQSTAAFGASLIIFFLNSAVGQVIVVHTWFLQIAAFWGLVLGDYNRTLMLKENSRAITRIPTIMQE